MRVTATGLLAVLKLPLPKRPSLFKPHAHTVPLFCTANECNEPADIETTLVTLATRVGQSTKVFVPKPTSPNWLVPHAHTLPSERRVSPNFWPADSPSVVRFV